MAFTPAEAAQQEELRSLAAGRIQREGVSGHITKLVTGIAKKVVQERAADHLHGNYMKAWSEHVDIKDGAVTPTLSRSLRGLDGWQSVRER